MRHFKCECLQNSHCSQGHFAPARHLSFSPPSLLPPFFLPFPFAPQFPFSIPPFIAFSFVSKLSPSIPYLSISLFPLTPLSLSFSPLPLTKTVGRLTLITVRFFPPQSDTHTHTHICWRSALPACQAGPRDGRTLQGEQDTGKCSNNKTLAYTGSISL